MKFVDEVPPARGALLRWRGEADELRRNPEQWALITDVDELSARQASALGNMIRRGRLLAFKPAGGFEAKVRGCGVYARYVGPPEDEE